MRTIIINNQHIAPLLPAVICLLSIFPDATVYAAHTYEIAVTDDFSSMTVEARYDRPIDRIFARAQDAGNYLRDARNCDNDTRIAARSRWLELPDRGIRCLRYSIDLRGAAAAERLNSILDDGNVAVSPTRWMWRPRLRGGEEIIATFNLGDGARVFVPWQSTNETGTRYRLIASPQSGSAIALFGRFEQRIEEVAGATLRIVMPDSRNKVELDTLLPWVLATANDLAGAYGRFPNPYASVFLVPVGNLGWDSESAVAFGRVVRDGGETVELMINQHRPVEQYYQEWTPIHEFSHLMLPYLDREQRWISEGFAQYYQNLFLARADQHSALDAWQKIYDGLERGRESAPGLSPNDAANGSMRDTRMKVYWSGASIALMADVELRRRSGGRESLDSILGQLQQCCLPSTYTWSGVELFRRLDGFLDKPLFLDLYREYANADDFPDARPLLTRLGVSVRDGRVTFDDTAELSGIRKAITNQAPEPH